MRKQRFQLNITIDRDTLEGLEYIKKEIYERKFKKELTYREFIRIMSKDIAKYYNHEIIYDDEKEIDFGLFPKLNLGK